MSETATIKITGLYGHTGLYGRLRFSVCDAKTKSWVEATFPNGPDGCNNWLDVGDTVFQVANSIYSSTSTACERVAQAELRLSTECPCSSTQIAVDEVIAIWVDEPSQPFPP